MAASARGLPLTRRQLVLRAGALGLGLLAGCGRLPGQEAPATKVWRLGVLSLVSPAWVYMDDFLGGLRDWGYVEGQNLRIEYRHSDGQREHLAGLATELVRLPVDIIVANGTPSTEAARAATTTLPIVFMAVSNPVEQEFVASLARPGANLTGTSDFGVALSTKRLELLVESVGSPARVGALRDVARGGPTLEWRAVEEAARTLRVELRDLEVRGPDDLPGTCDAARAMQCDALLPLTSPLILQNLAQIVSLAEQYRLPVMYFQRAHAVGGGLLAYGPRYPDLYRRTGYYVDRILKGAKPADLPVEQPTTFDFVINLKTAQALGLTIPQHVLLQATEIIQ
jgi:putative ABC transport system substrate-binding protein